MDIILASASPRRRELMKYVADEFKCESADIEEIIPNGISADESAEFLAVRKALFVAQKHAGNWGNWGNLGNLDNLDNLGNTNNSDSLVIGCDTVVILDGKVYGKPTDEKNAEEMLRALSGRTHKVITGVCLCHGKKSLSFSDVTEVSFYELSDSEIYSYIATGEPFDKAGSYGIQGFGGMLVRKINGDFFNVVGLPAARLKREIAAFLQQ